MQRRAASDSGAGQMLGDDPISCPSLMNMGPSAQKASTIPVDASACHDVVRG
jgi:hypothetical protein